MPLLVKTKGHVRTNVAETGINIWVNLGVNVIKLFSLNAVN